MAVQFAKKLGNRVTVFTTSQDKAEFAHKMGANEAIVVGKGEIAQAPSSKLDILLSTVPAALDWVPYIDFLESGSALAFVGFPDAPLSIPLFPLLMKQRRIVTESIQDTSPRIHSESRLRTGEIKNLYPMKLAPRIYP